MSGGEESRPVVEMENVVFSYDGAPVLQDVDLTVEDGEFCALIGPNGGGKTTLIKLMLGLLQPDAGTVRLLGREPKMSAALAGYVPQRVPADTGFPVSVMDVALMGRLRGPGGQFRFSGRDREAAREALERLGMWPHRHRRIGRLSGGQRQRVIIARALAAEPRVLFLDEPGSSVDPTGQADLYRLLRELNRTITIVLVSHEIMTLSSYVKSVACVNRKVHYHGSSEMTQDMLDMAYECPVELVAHGVPHRVLRTHDDDRDHGHGDDDA
ncbi:MAG: metal ABC transporter ATP-binding protein [Desulfatibacillaceae bacterium]